MCWRAKSSDYEKSPVLYISFNTLLRGRGGSTQEKRLILKDWNSQGSKNTENWYVNAIPYRDK
jgi:hypothetical protein